MRSDIRVSFTHEQFAALLRLARGKQFLHARLLTTTDTEGFHLYDAFVAIVSRAETIARKQKRFGTLGDE